MAKEVKETARLTITTHSDDTCSVKTKGDIEILTKAIISVMLQDDEENLFREMILISAGVAVEKFRLEQEEMKQKAAKKKKK